MIVELSLFVLGLVALTIGADWLVTGASNLAEKRGVKPLVLGLTVVAFGTSAPEFVVSITAVLQNKGGLAVGNVMGSTVANVGLIVGLGALIRPISVHRRLIRREGPLVIFVLAIVMLLSWNEALGRLDGLALITGFTIYLTILVRWGLKDVDPMGANDKADAPIDAAMAPPATSDLHPPPQHSSEWRIPAIPRVLVGLVLLAAGAHWLVIGAVEIARYFEVSEEIIGATIVAVGTSIPELASTVAAALRRLGDIAVGNVIGSNIFNLGFVLGGAALVKPLPLSPTTVGLQVVPALLFCAVLLPLAYTGSRISRAEGMFLLAGYVTFVVWLI